MLFPVILWVNLPGMMAGVALGASQRQDAFPSQHTITVKIEVSSSLGVNLRGETSSPGRVIKVGDPASGKVTYVILDD